MAHQRAIFLITEPAFIYCWIPHPVNIKKKKKKKKKKNVTNYNKRISLLSSAGTLSGPKPAH